MRKSLWTQYKEILISLKENKTLEIEHPCNLQERGYCYLHAVLKRLRREGEGSFRIKHLRQGLAQISRRAEKSSVFKFKIIKTEQLVSFPESLRQQLLGLKPGESFLSDHPGYFCTDQGCSVSCIASRLKRQGKGTWQVKHLKRGIAVVRRIE